MANTDPVEFQLLDTDLQTVIAILPAAEMSVFQPLNEPGSGSLKIPLGSSIASSIDSGQFARVKYRGALRGGFFVENIGITDASSGEGGDRWIQLSGRGPLAILDEAIVWQTGVSTVRTYDGTMGSVMIDLIDEAIARGAITNVTYDFSDTLDSDGAAWTDDNPIELAVGMKLLEVLRKFAGYGIDFDITLESDGTFTLHAYVEKGDDLSETVYFRVGQNCLELARQEQGAGIRNALNVKYPEGFLHLTDAASIAAYRRRELLQREEAAGSPQAAQTFGQAKLELSKDPKASLNVKITDQVNPMIYEDYNLGDTVVLDREGAEEDRRIRGLQLTFQGEDYAEVVVTLNSMILENEIRMALDLEELKSLYATALEAELEAVSFWAAVGQEATGTNVKCILISGQYLYAGGVFTEIGNVEANNIARYDIYKDQWEPLGAGTDGQVRAIAVVGANVFIGGDFTTAGGVAVNYVAKWDGSAWSDPGGGVASAVYALEADGTDLLVGGALTYVRRWNGAAWSNVGGILNGDVWAIHKDGLGDIWIGGDFTASGATTLNYAAKLNGAAWDALGAGLNDYVLAITSIGSNIFFGGGFTQAGGAGAAYVAEWSGAAWSPLGTGLGNICHSLAASLTDVYAGGIFVTAGGISALRIARWNGVNWETLDQGVGGPCYSIQIYNLLDVYVGLDATGAYDGGMRKGADLVAAYFTKFQDLHDYLEAGSQAAHPHPPDQSIQYNKNGRFMGETALRWDYTNKNLLVGDGDPPVLGSKTIHNVGSGSSPANLLWAHGTSAAGFIAGLRSRGTLGAPTAVQADDVLFRVRGRGYDGTGWSNTQLEARFLANENWTGSNHGTRLEIWATPNGSTTNTLLATFEQAKISLAAPTYININSATALLVEQDGVKDNVLVVDTANATVGINRVPALYDVEISSDFVALYGGGYFVFRSSDDIYNPSFIGLKSKGGAAIPASGYGLAQFLGQGFEGTDYKPAAAIEVYSAGAFTPTSSPGRLHFSTTPAGTIVPVTRLLINTNGNIANGLFTPQGALHIKGFADDQQLIIQAYSTQTNNLQEWQNSAGAIQLALAGNARDFILDTTTGSKIGTATSQKLGFWNATPIIQPTTGIAAAAFVANTSGIADDSATFDGYTIGQVVKALRNVGLLA